MSPLPSKNCSRVEATASLAALRQAVWELIAPYAREVIFGVNFVAAVFLPVALKLLSPAHTADRLLAVALLGIPTFNMLFIALFWPTKRP